MAGSADAWMILRAGRIRVGEADFDLYLEVAAWGLELGQWRDASKYQHVVGASIADAGTGQVVGVIEVSPGLLLWRPPEDFGRAAEEFELLVRDHDVIAGSLLMAHNMLRLGYVADEGLALGLSTRVMPSVLHSSISHYVDFRSIYSYSYRGVAHVSTYGDIYYNYVWPEGQGGPVEEKDGVLYVVAPVEEGELRRVALEALEPWRPATATVKRLASGCCPPTTRYAVEVRSASPEFNVASFLGAYIPEVARRVKELVDEKVEQARAAQA